VSRRAFQTKAIRKTAIGSEKLYKIRGHFSEEMARGANIQALEIEKNLERNKQRVPLTGA